MKPPKSHAHPTLMKYLTPAEQKVLLMVQRHRAEFWRRLSRLKAAARNTKRTLLFAVSFGLLLASASAAPVASTESAGAKIAPLVSVESLYNQANADQRAGHFGQAILGYERAKLLSPNDPAIAQNLRLAREKAELAAPHTAAWQRSTQALTWNAIAGLGSICLLLFGLLAFGTRLLPRSVRSAARSFTAGFGIIAAVSFGALAARWPEMHRAVVESPDATAHIAPADASEGVFTLKPGEIVSVGREHGGFALIHTDDSRSGWLRKSDFQQIIPPAARLSSM